MLNQPAPAPWPGPIRTPSERGTSFWPAGADVYRIVEAPPSTYLQGPFHLTDQELVDTAQAIACRLAVASCGLLAPRSTLTSGGYDALALFAAASDQLRFAQPAEASAVLGRACTTISRLADAEARVVYEGCQVTLHEFSNLSLAMRCYRARPCQQWTMDASAADLHRIASVNRALALRLTAGACRALFGQDATYEDRLADALGIYARAFAERDRWTMRLARMRARLIAQEANRRPVPPGVLGTCRPGSAGSGPPGVA